MSTGLRERTIKKEKNRDKRPTAIAKYIRIPSSKMELVLNLIRRKGYEDAVAVLKNTNKSSGSAVLKVLESAAANAENNSSMIKDNLFVAECCALNGPTLKRMMPRARGRADRILKRSCHIRIILDERKESTKDSGRTQNSKKKDKVKVKNTDGKEIPSTEAERPLADVPNTSKPLGTKKVEKRTKASVQSEKESK
jgi:large subunit ribosomal protein L22